MRQFSRISPCLTGLLLLCASACDDSFESKVDILYLDADGTAVTSPQDVSVVKSGVGGCEYRLEFDNPAKHPNWAVHEVAGDQGDRQRYTESDCGGASFTQTQAANAQHFEEQTLYYWVMEAREYAMRELWVTPDDWSGPPIKHATTRVDPYVLTAGGFAKSCLPDPRDGCMRAFPHEGPRLYIRTGTVAAPLTAHEFGHYAAGYVFGHMDTFSYDFTKCGKRAFQEAIAEMFMSAMLHDKRQVYYASLSPLTAGTPRSSFRFTTASIWDGQCGADEYVMGRPLVQAFHESLWDPIWDSAEANHAMADAFSYALANNKGHRIEMMAGDIVDQIHRTQSDTNITGRIEEIFRAHGFLMVGDTCTANVECTGPRTTRCDTTRTPSLCIPDDGVGVDGDYCTNNRHCENANCVSVTPTTGGTCQPGGEIGDACETNAGCAGARTTRCDTTRSPNLCIPDDGEGIDGDYCTNNRHCENANCVGVTPTTGGMCQPGGEIRDSCETDAGCTGTRTSRCDTSVTPNQCIPDDGTGRDGEYCTNNSQCDGRENLVCRTDAGSAPQPGRCGQ